MVFLIFGFLLTVLSGVVSYQLKRKENLVAKKANRETHFLFIVLILGAISTLWAGIDAKIDSKRSTSQLKTKDSLYTDLLTKTRDSIISAKEEISNLREISSQEGNKLRDSLITSKNQIITNQKSNFLELYNQTTGGNIIPHIHPLAYEKDVITIGITNPGEYAVHDLRISYVDGYRMKMDLGDCSWERHPTEIMKYMTGTEIGAIQANIFVPLFSERIPPTWDELWYRFYVFYKTGAYRWFIKWVRNSQGEFRTVASTYFDEKTNEEIKFDSNGVGKRIPLPKNRLPVKK